MKKQLSILILSLLLIIGMTACGASTQEQENTVDTSAESQNVQKSEDTDAQESQESGDASSQAPDETPTESGGKILVVYFSRADNIVFDPDVDAVTSASINLDGETVSGNAKLLADMAQAATGGEIFSIQTVEKYPSAYRATTDQANTEQADNARPELATHVEDMDAVDTVVLIYPNWWGGLPMPVYTFLEEYDFTGKTILPLCTHEGSGLSRTESALADACPGATVLKGLAVRGGSATSASADVEEWITASGILEE